VEVDIKKVAKELMVSGANAGLRILTSQFASVAKLKTSDDQVLNATANRFFEFDKNYAYDR
jgi:hypothetical protein